MKTLPFVPIKDFAPIAPVASTEYLLVVNPKVPATTLKDFLRYAKEHPRQLNFSSGGMGTSDHLAGELFNSATGAGVVHVPYKGGAQGLTDVVSGQVQMTFITPPPGLPFIKSGQLRALAVSGDRRLASLPDVPTFAESGFLQLDIGQWYGMLAPRGTPAAIVEKIAADIARAQTLPDVKERLAGLGTVPFTMTPTQFTKLMNADEAKYAKVVKDAGIKPEE